MKLVLFQEFFVEKITKLVNDFLIQLYKLLGYYTIDTVFGTAIITIPFWPGVKV
jgi:hypothetical protein